jgi:SNF2 family DNA or RNA helicase
MINLASQSANAILADDMGLGKTIQAISYLAYLKQ